MTSRKIQTGAAILGSNDAQAARNLERLTAAKLLGVNVLASPGAGKTSLIKALLAGLAPSYKLGVIEGDVAGSIDTDAIVALGYPATQINTDGGCHLDAAMIDTAITRLGVAGPGFVFIENIGNLICPTSFALGESLRLVIASVPEGDDKPIKYPAVFASADALVLSKIDLLGHVDFRMDYFEAGVRAVNGRAPIFRTSCRTKQGIQAVLDWLTGHASQRHWMRP